MQGQTTGTSFLIAGYLITWTVLAWYIWRINRRSREAGRALEAAEVTAATDREAGA